MKKLILFFILLSSPAFAQTATSGANGLPRIMAQNNVTIVYSTITGQPLMLVIDAVNLTDQAFNPPNSIQVAVLPAVYNAMTAPDLRNFIATNTPSTSAGVIQ